MNVLVAGGGAWGTALAINLVRFGLPGTQVRLWVRDAAQAEAMRATRENTRYLPGIALPAGLEVFSADVAALPSLAQGSDAVILATPMAALRGLLHTLRDSQTPLAWLCKGFEKADTSKGITGGLLPHEVHAQVGCQAPCAVLSGPTFAQEVARGAPSALVAASHDASSRQRWVSLLHNPTLRVYASADVPGVEVGGAVKNVLAIATGLCDGLQLGLNARAALITRGLAEMTRLGLALQGRTETFMGLSGLGDLVLTATGDLSRNRKVGLLLAQGLSLADTVASLGHVAEGVYSARTVVQRAAALHVDMPIAQSVVRLLDGHATPGDVVRELMGREPRAEGV